MATSRRRRRRRLKSWVVWVIILVIVLVIAGVIAVIAAASKNAPSTELTDLEYYYNLKINAMEGRDAAASNEMAIVIDGNILGERAFQDDSGVIYVSHSFVQSYIDERFYYDDVEGRFLVTTATQIIETGLDMSYYIQDGSQVATEYAPLVTKNGTLYLAMEFVDKFSAASYKAYTDPARLVIWTATGNTEYCNAEEKTYVRALNEDSSVDKKSEVVGTVASGSKLMIIGDSVGDWYKVVSEEGWVGYVDMNAVGKTYTEDVTGDYNEPEYTRLSLGETVKLGWGGVYAAEANSNYSWYTEGTAINVYCPTWYSLAGADGSVDMYSDAEYVQMAHDDGYQVWAMFSDTENGTEYIKEVLTHTSIRTLLIETLINDMVSKGIDGINVDCECIGSDFGEDFIQFIRELSISCRKEGLYLSVDNYAPYEYNSCYHIEEQGRICDYVIIMAYDDYLGSGEEGPNSSLPFIKEVMELATSKVDSSRLICALPFYSRIWYKDSAGTLTRKEYAMSDIWEMFDQIVADVQYLEEDGVYYTTYEYGDQTAYAYAEDVDTIEKKLELVKTFNLAGVAFWQLGQEYSSTWDVIAAY